jgi:hypothetical protein
MATEHPPAERAHRSEVAKAGTVKNLAEAIAEQITTQQGLGADISGSFDVDIVYNGVEYKLAVIAPQDGTEDQGYWIATGVRIDTDTHEENEFLDCAFKDQDNWKIGLGLPVPITFTNGEIKQIRASFQMGVVPPTGGTVPIEA